MFNKTLLAAALVVALCATAASASIQGSYSYTSSGSCSGNANAITYVGTNLNPFYLIFFF